MKKYAHTHAKSTWPAVQQPKKAKTKKPKLKKAGDLTLEDLDDVSDTEMEIEDDEQKGSGHTYRS